VVAALGLSSCAEKPCSVQPVQGQLQVDGKPAANALVTFHPANAAPDAPHPTGLTDAQGVFRLTSFRENDGAPAGDYAVAVTWFRSVPSRDPRDDRFKSVNFLPARYASPKTSQLKATVAKGAGALPPLQLKTR
jgi:hypothetical protein